ncbi:MAG: hypothetical protein ACI35R_17440 [Bacillus sp. (in: firmicutes)]
MARNSDFTIRLELDRNLVSYFSRNAPSKMKEAREKAVHAAGMVWADETKEVTREDDHIDTSLYINSIGYSTGSPSQPLYQMLGNNNESALNIGADVSYAEHLERRYNIMARGLDRSEDRMGRVAEAQIKRVLNL